MEYSELTLCNCSFTLQDSSTAPTCVPESSEVLAKCVVQDDGDSLISSGMTSGTTSK